MNKEKIHFGQFLKNVATIAIPVALQNLLTTTGSMVDTIMLASLGQNTVGAVGLCAQYSSLMFSCYWGFVGGGMLFFSQYWGARDDDGIHRSYGTTLTFLLAVAFVFMLAALFFPYQVISLYTDKEAIRAIGREYLSVVGFFAPFQVLSVGMSSLLRSTERVRIPLYASIASVGTNILLNWLLINGVGPFPRMGVRGAALATVIASIVNAGVILLCAWKTHYSYLFAFRRHFHWGRGWMKIYLLKCFPIICNELFIGIALMITNMVLGRQSEEAIAAIAVFRTLEGLVIGFFAGFSNAASVLVGKRVGAGELWGAWQRAVRLVYLCGGFIGLISLGLWILHSPILHMMSLDGESFTIGSQILGVYCIVCVIRMMNWVQNDTYRSAGDARKGTILEIVFMYVMVLPCVVSAGLWWKLPMIWVFICCYIDEPIRFVLMQIHLYSGKWIRPVTEQGLAALPKFREELQGGRQH